MLTRLGSHILVPAQYMSFKHRKKFGEGRQQLAHDFGGKEVSIIAQDGIKLNGMLLRKPESYGDSLRNRKLLIRFGGNGENYESHGLNSEYIQNAHRLGYDVLLHNYRGVGKCEGSPTQANLAKDGQSVLDFVLNQGYKSKDVLVHGFSLGGAVATKALASKPEEYKNIKFICDRSFSSIKPVIKNFSIWSIFKNILLFLLNICNWNIDVREDWKKIKGQKLLIFSYADEVIPLKGSLTYAMQEENAVDPNIIFYIPRASHCSPLTYESMKFLTSYVDGSSGHFACHINAYYQRAKAAIA